MYGECFIIFSHPQPVVICREGQDINIQDYMKFDRTYRCVFHQMGTPGMFEVCINILRIHSLTHYICIRLQVQSVYGNAVESTTCVKY